MATPLALVAPSSVNRAALVGGTAFLEGSATPDWDARGLCAWFAEHLVAPGTMRTPLLVTEPSAGSVALHAGTASSPRQLSRIVVAARARVLNALRGLIASPSDDRFLSAAIFGGLVWRQRVQGAPQWMARPQPTTPLSGIVLSLFAVDALSHRELYDQSLSVCETCNRVTFHEGARWRCPEHMPPVSGVIRKVAPEPWMAAVAAR